MLGDRLLGTLAFGSYERDAIAPDEFEFLTTISQYLAIAIERALRENALRQAQQSLREHAVILETKIEERTAKLHETIAQLESFSYTIAHDLRAPIRSLKGYSEILLSDFAANVPEAGQAMLNRIRRASNRLDALTRDLLAFSKIAREDVQLSPVDVDELIHDLIVTTPALQNVVTIQAPLGTVLAQRTLLEQCLANLFDNAIKFTGSGVTPRITVRGEDRGPDASVGGLQPGPAFHPATGRAHRDTAHGLANAMFGATDDTKSKSRRIWVEDNGIGIAPVAHHKVFGIFERVSGLDNVEGTGIGLAIVARAMQQMGGACGVESNLGTGSRFWLELAAS
jgi:signal transduction histidine kinase